MSSTNDVDLVRDYYDRNTRRFIGLGHGGPRSAIRRAVWGPGVATRDDAIDYVNALILRELRQSGATSIIDLGCGVGGSIAFLGSGMAAEFAGLTVSGVQAELGSRLLEEHGLRARILSGDFTDPLAWDRFDRKEWDAAIAVESLLHVPPERNVFDLVSRRLRRGGRLVVVDDFIGRDPNPAEPGGGRPRCERRLLDEIRRGWLANGLCSRDAFVGAAADRGLVLAEMRDLTPYLELGRPRDRAIRLFMAVAGRLPLAAPWFLNLLGGNALQTALMSGLVRYCYLVFTKGSGGASTA